MAMLLNTTLSSGFIANYYRISSFSINRVTSQISVGVSLWKDQASRDANLSPINGKAYLITGSDYSTITSSSNLVQAIYNYLKTLPDFAGEVDV